jgi:hypothetical protein
MLLFEHKRGYSMVCVKQKRARSMVSLFLSRMLGAPVEDSDKRKDAAVRVSVNTITYGTAQERNATLCNRCRHLTFVVKSGSEVLLNKRRGS